MNLHSVADNFEIKPINKDTVHRICSGQVVLSLAIAMKELVENSIDAGATNIGIHLKDYGAELLEVSDNGCGVRKDNFRALTLKHYTSKLQDFEDLEHIGTLGFRGEALSSLCALSRVEITSRHSSEEVATRVKYDCGGNIESEEISARGQGTTVTLNDLFATLPVRRKEFMKNLKKEFAKLCNLLYAYCLLPSGVKYICTNMTDKGTKTTVVQTEGNKSIRDNIISVFGVKQLTTLVEVTTTSPDETICDEYQLDLNPGDELPFILDFFISSSRHGDGRSSSDRQFFYINNRPCEPTKIIKLINQVYKQFNNKQYPFVYLNIQTKSGTVDVNITPDKRQVFLEQEKLLLATVKASLLETFKDFPSTFKSQNLEVSRTILKSANSSSNRNNLKRSFTDHESAGKSRSIVESFSKRSRSDPTPMNSNILERFGRSDTSSSFMSDITIEELNSSQEEADNRLEELIKIACKLVKEDELTVSEDEQQSLTTNLTIDSPIKNQRREVPLTATFKSIKEALQAESTQNEACTSENSVKFRSNIAPDSNQSAEEELDKHISKNDFSRMEIIGQFNKGFIITKLASDLFIVDQHATDEKYNFEQLQLNTVIESQKLVSPKLLELTAAARSTLTEHEAVFKKNGFDFKHEDNKVFLTSVPISNKTVFGKNDVDEMIFILQEDSSQNQTCRPSRVRAMFASRACRKSVMIGQSLNKAEMRKLVDHMGHIEQPWNCPHGRPTMRHLVNLSLLTENIDKVST